MSSIGWMTAKFVEGESLDNFVKFSFAANFAFEEVFTNRQASNNLIRRFPLSIGKEYEQSRGARALIDG